MAALTAIPIGRLHVVDRLSVILAVVLFTEDAVTLHMTVQPCVDDALEGWLNDPTAWHVTDNLGTVYRIKAAGSRGNDLACQASMTWQPSSPLAASSLTFEAVIDGMLVLSERVDLQPGREQEC